MRSTGIVLSCTLALVLAAFAYWFLSPDRRSPLPPTERASVRDSHFGAATGAAADGRDDLAADRHHEDGQPTPGAATLRVRVCDEAGAPIAGARVGVLKPAEPNRNGVVEAPLEFVDGTSAATSAMGESDVALPDATAIVDVAATAPGFAAGFWPRARVGDEIGLELGPAAELTGFVRDRRGVPVAGAAIRWSCNGRRRASGATKSSADGSYHLVDVVEVPSHVDASETFFPWFEVEADGFAPLYCRCGVTKSDARHWKLDFWLLRGGRLRGRIVDQATGVAVAGADVFLRNIESCAPAPKLRTKSGADGSYLLEQVPAFGVQNSFPLDGWWNSGLVGDLCVVAAGHGSDWRRIRAPDDEEDVVRDFELPPVCDLHGRVVDERGAPIERASLELSQSGGVHGASSYDLEHRFALGDPAACIRTDRDGRYVIYDVPILTGADATTRIWADGMTASGVALQRTRVDVVPVAGADVAVPDIVLMPSAAAARSVVHFVDEAGLDVAGATFFTLDGSGRGLMVYSPDDWHQRADRTGRSPIYGSDAPSDSPQRVRVVARNDGFATAVVDLPTVPAETTIALKPEHCLRGVIRDVDGRPGLADVSAVTIDDPNAEIFGVGGTAHSSPTTGRFVVRQLSAGPWRVVATRRHDDDSAETATVDNVTDERADLEIVLKGSGDPIPKRPWEEGAPSDPALGRVEVGLHLADSGVPVVHAEFSLGPPGHERRDARQVAPGRYLFERVAPGDAPLRVEVKNAVTATRSLHVDAGATTEIAVEIASGRAISGHLALAELPKRTWMEVVVIDAANGATTGFAVAGDGSFRLRGLDPAKSYRLGFDFVDEQSCMHHWLCAEPPRAAIDSDADWRPRFAATGWITISMGKADHVPAATTVRIVDAAGHDADLFVARGCESPLVRHVLPGAYTVRLEFPDGSTQEQRVNVARSDEHFAANFDER